MKETDCEKESALQGLEGVVLVTVVKWCVSGAKDLRLLVESSISGERSCGMIDLPTEAWWKQVEGKDTDDLRNGFCWEV